MFDSLFHTPFLLSSWNVNFIPRNLRLMLLLFLQRRRELSSKCLPCLALSLSQLALVERPLLARSLQNFILKFNDTTS